MKKILSLLLITAVVLLSLGGCEKNSTADNGKINIIDQYRSEKFSNSTGVEADRCVYVGNNIYLLGMYYDSAEAAIDSVEYK